MFPIQLTRDYGPHPMEIPWSVAQRAYSVYASRYGRDQSCARLAERGGFCPREMDDLLPGWKEEVSEVAMLTQENQRLRNLAAKAIAALEMAHVAVNRTGWEDGPTLNEASRDLLNATENLKCLLKQVSEA